MIATTERLSDYMKLYDYLPVMDGDQIWKLRKVAIGILDMSVFTEIEIHVLQARLLLENKND